MHTGYHTVSCAYCHCPPNGYSHACSSAYGHTFTNPYRDTTAHRYLDFDTDASPLTDFDAHRHYWVHGQ